MECILIILIFVMNQSEADGAKSAAAGTFEIIKASQKHKRNDAPNGFCILHIVQAANNNKAG